MRFGVQLPETEYEATWREMEDMARVSEEVGLDSLWVGDHLLYDEGGERSGPWEAWSVLAGLAAVTERIEIGPLVAALPFHAPAVLAKAAATIDEISGGRLIFGIGAGWNEVEFTAFGLPFEQRVNRFAEAFEIIRRLLAGERLDFDGKFYRLKGCELLPRPPRPGEMPFMVGSNRPRMLSLTLPYVTWWNSWYSAFGNDPARVGELVGSIVQACVESGRDPATLKKSVALYFGFDGKPQRRTEGTPRWGSIEDHLARLHQIEAAGIDEVQGILDPIAAETIEKYGEIVAAYRSSR
ncbi:MAG: LLM class flavin-dependent oxidoreductase [Acidimicrobiia bacterium]|nr:LLM class flavin-dependent oxidoreductase [Acidimicrobiia bacterium]MDQ3500793.1 LLM class flavin-dependent oxidoreductase [Actinomycetota bacterium]